ncbi:Aminodeoxychorismate synthase chloroplastic [Bienertia sinuspersici]
MERLRSFFCFNSSTPSTVFLPIITIFTKLPSRFWHKAKGIRFLFLSLFSSKREWLISLSKDKELFEGYVDIETMW